MAGSLRPDEIQLRVLIDGSPARKELVDLSQLTAKLRDEQKRLKEQQDKLRDDKRAAQAKGDMAAVRELTKAEAQLREERGRNNAAIVEAEKKSAELRKGIGLEALSVRELRNELRAAKSAYDAATPKTEQWVQARTRLDQVNTALNRLTKEANIQQQVWERIRGQYKLTDMTIEQLELELQRLRGLLHTMAPKDTGLGKVQADIRATERQLAAMRTGLGPFGRMWGEVKSQVAAAGAVLAGMFAAGGIVNGFQGLVRSSKEYSDQLADVRKTTGLTGDAVKALASEISRIDTRTSRQELLALARDAGKLGISGRDDIMAFVQAGNQIRTALGEDLGDDAIKNIAKLVDLFKLKDQFGLEQAMLNVGSAINELGMSSTASEGYMVEFLRRMGGIAPLAGITIDQTLALGATLDSLGQTSEVSSTALSKLFVKLGTDAEKYAGLAGMSVEKFRGILQNNALEAFIAVLEGTKQTEGGVVSLAETLGEMGIDAARAAGVFGVLGNNTERLREQMALANAAFNEGTSITDEYALKNNNLAAQIEKLGKEFNKLFANNTMVEWLTGLVGMARDSVAWIQRNRDAVLFFLKVLVTATATWVSYRVAVAATVQAQRLAALATTGLRTVYQLLTGQITLASVATKGFNTALKANPIGLVVSALTAAVGLLWSFNNSLKDAAANAGAETAQLRILHAQILTTNVGTDERRKLIEQLKQAYPQYLSQLNADTTTNEELGKAVEFVNQQLINKAILAKADQLIEEQNARAAERRLEQFEREQALRQRLVELSQESGVPLEEAGSAVEQAQKFLSAFERTQGKPLLGIDRSLLDKDITAIKAWEAEFRKETNQSNALVQRRIELMRQLGMDTAKTADAQQKFGEAQAESAGEGQAAVRSVAFLNDAIKSLQEEQQKAADPAAYKRLQDQIDALEKERDRITGARREQRAQQNQDHLDDLLRQYQEFEGRLRLDTLTDDQRELEELDLKHAAELEKVRKQQAELIKAKKLTPEQAQTDLGALGAQQARERDNLIRQQNDRRFDEARKANERIEAQLREGIDARLKNELDALDAEIELANQRGESVEQLTQQRSALLLRIYERNALQLIEAEESKWDTILSDARAALEQYQQAIAASGMEPDDAQDAEIDRQNQAILNLEQQKHRALLALQRRYHQQKAVAERDSSRAEQLEYARRLQNVAEWSNALSSIMAGAMQMRDAEIQIAEQRADADGERTAEEIAGLRQLEAARRQAALRHLAVQAAAAIASAVASALASTIPFPGNLLAAAPAVGTVLGLIAQARAILNSTDGSGQQTGQAPGAGGLQNVPLGAEGLQARDGKVLRAADGGGVLGGSYHTQGGNTLYDDRTGRPLANVERDELMLIMSRRATEANRDLIPMLLDASRRGARLPVLQRPVAMPSAQRVRQAMGVPTMAQGGTLYTFTKATGMARAPGDPPPSDPAMLHALQAVVSETRAARRATERIRTLKISLFDEQRRRSEYERIQQLNKGSRAS